ncbi:23S rRNA (pseudouridine(1915)-N(3))-methyltransferase RlmH [Agrobacterium vitis]|uniref:Ribosomal RNA large subunit methyltransferase H n=1 Tax=Agrobacterium vitis TaxID=373 RepID=A0ABD6GIX4_AGRVI|nr:23S rRNA (pseudouridine(1915)-N(3))-methyltransferase RlmH [Agrobacterium vitis]MUO79683.1 23S rRNA (pseudouridine(1915)-N(3))-methyltransferase RlmH [Agrobacterium vitis]MUO96835.1 23S rRNA (pseudouridine(1915)-N(3))-methyltransferase RlmH [Agrobacterium vitis]MUP07704.1 23S rRNA (pseudouridine(1915)-N(3))-methyltransferase RlmH [Agrobacterium vitis]MUZ83612.1 23S rRNA (pseudouridine(1915)-N(3))-methyltransferase RlmH [Agrobacterium vitis]MVA11897.1 23S rRNA (pseudouridine(1915)-N(3))-meth
MRIGIVAVGRLKAGPEKDLVSRYLDRFAKAGPASGLEFSRVSELPESRASNSATRKREEATQIEKSLPDNPLVVALDERGKSWDSQEFAAYVGDHKDRGRRDMVIVIGGADGLDPDFRDRADLVLNLGKMTWPHQLVRIMLAEQLYRAVTILSGHPYHRS